MRTKISLAVALLFAAVATQAVIAANSPRAAGSTLEVRVNDNGNVQVEGAKVASISGNTINAVTNFGSYAINWALKVSDAKIVRRYDAKASLAEISVGDYISFSGNMDTAASAGAVAVNAKHIKDWSIQAGSRADFSGVIQSINSAAKSFVLVASGKTITVFTDGQTKINKALEAGAKVDSATGVFNNLTNTLQADVIKMDNARPSITFISPNSAEKFSQGDTMRIKWNSTGLVSADVVNISVLGSNVVMTATGSEKQKDWQIPANFAAGKYRIYVSATKNGTIYSDTSKEFAVSAAVAPNPSVKLLSPNGGTFKRGGTMNVSWNPIALNAQDTIQFSILNCVYPNANCNKTPLSFTTTGDKTTALLDIPNNAPTGSKIKLQISVLRNNAVIASDKSNNFLTIKAK